MCPSVFTLFSWKKLLSSNPRRFLSSLLLCGAFFYNLIQNSHCSRNFFFHVYKVTGSKQILVAVLCSCANSPVSGRGRFAFKFPALCKSQGTTVLQFLSFYIFCLFLKKSYKNIEFIIYFSISFYRLLLSGSIVLSFSSGEKMNTRVRTALQAMKAPLNHRKVNFFLTPSITLFSFSFFFCFLFLFVTI